MLAIAVILFVVFVHKVDGRSALAVVIQIGTGSRTNGDRVGNVAVTIRIINARYCDRLCRLPIPGGEGQGVRANAPLSRVRA